MLHYFSKSSSKPHTKPMPELNNRWQQYAHDAPSWPKLKRRRTVPNWQFCVIQRAILLLKLHSVVPSSPKMSKRRKVDIECRVFWEKWTISYFLFFFTGVNRKPVWFGVFTASFSAQRIEHLAPVWDSSWWKIQPLARKEKINEMLAGLKTVCF